MIAIPLAIITTIVLFLCHVWHVPTEINMTVGIIGYGLSFLGLMVLD